MGDCNGNSGCGCDDVLAHGVVNPPKQTFASGPAAYRIENMDCPTEEALIRSKLMGLPGVNKLEFNLMQRVLTVHHECSSLDLVESALASIKMDAVRLNDASGSRTTRLAIQKMDCPTEEALIRSKLSKIPAIHQLEFNLMQRVLTVHHASKSLSEIVSAIRSLGFDVRVIEAENESRIPTVVSSKWWPLAVSGAAAIGAEVVDWTSKGSFWPVLLLALFAIFTSGLSTYKKGWIALRNLNLNMNALMSIAVTGAMVIGQFPEAAMVMVLFALAEFIEAKSLDHARNAIRDLMNIVPDFVTIQQPDGSWKEIVAKIAGIGDLVRVKPGERIALDGIVASGASTINQAPITGESLPVEKTHGDPVFAGTINNSGSLEYRVTALADESVLARIIHTVEAAQGNRAPTQRFVDQFARWYTPSVFLVAVAMAVLPPLIAGFTWMEWIYRSLVLLVIACPCALVISTPVSIVSGLAAAARRGILIKGGGHLEGGYKLRWLALDKTGTITKGQPEQTDFFPWQNADAEVSRIVAASLSKLSDHPVSQALTKSAMLDDSSLLVVAEFSALPGQGVRGRISGTLYHLGNHRMVEALGLCSPDLEAKIESLEVQGKTVVMLVGEASVLSIYAVADAIKPSSRIAIAQLHEMGVKTVMLTGDNHHTAKVIAEQAGVDSVLANLLPDEKLKEIERLASLGRVGMVGDGINDAPALARSDIGFAMGAAGSDVAIETADVALMDDDLRKIPDFLRLSRSTVWVLRQNIVLALGIKAVFLALAFGGHATMWMAVFADMGASLLVVGNGLRLLRR